MIFSAERDELLRLARQAGKAVPKTDAIKEMNGIHLAVNDRSGKVTLTATNFEISIQASAGASVEESGAVIVDARLFPAILAKLPDKDVRLVSGRDNRSIHIQSGEARFDLHVLPGDKYPLPELPLPTGMVSAAGIPELAKRAVFAASTDKDARPGMLCVNLMLSSTGLKAAACNGLQLIEAEGDTDCKGDISLLVPAASMQTLAAIAEDDAVFEVGTTGKTVVFWDGSLLFSARLVDGNYLNTGAVFDGFKKAHTVMATAEEMRQAVSTATGLSEDDHRLTISLEDTGLTLECSKAKDADADKWGLISFQNVVLVKAAVSEPSGTPFYQDGRRLLAGLNHMTGQIVMEFSARGDLVLRDAKSRYFQGALAPPRAKAKKGKAA